ncbi:hypothetical protein ABK040_000750 [Willaertia magna]
MYNNSILKKEELNFGKAVYFKYEPKDNIPYIVNISERDEGRKAKLTKQFKELFYKEEISGSFRCTRHYPHPRTLFTACKLSNVCILNSGQFVLFMDDSLYKKKYESGHYNTHPWFNVQGREETDRGDVRIKIIPSSKVKEYKFANNFSFYQDPTFLTVRYAAGNIGHTIMENILPVFQLLLQYQENLSMDNNILFLDDAYQHNIASYGYPKDLTESVSMKWFGMLTKHPILQKCSPIKGKGMTITNTPCRNQEEENNEHLVPNGDGTVIESCFSSLAGGNSHSYFLDFHKREFIVPLLRKFIYNNLGLLSNDRAVIKKQDDNVQFLIGIQQKPPTAQLGYIIENTDEIVQYFKENLPKEYKIIKIKLEDKTFYQQLELFDKLDAYISTQGSASYMGAFLKDDAWLFYGPKCDTKDRGKTFDCHDQFGKMVHSSFPNIHYYPILKQEVTHCTFAPSSVYIESCNVKVDAVKLYDIVFNALGAVRRKRETEKKLKNF